MPDKIIHKELSFKVTGCLFDVHNEVGPGVREECYQKAIELRLAIAGIPFVAKPATRRELIYRDQVADVFEPDLLVAEQMILELKHLPDGFAQANFTQLLSYLKFWNWQLGLLVNMAMDHCHVKRLPFTPAIVNPEEDYSFIESVICSEDRPLLRTIRESLLEIHRSIGLGYADTTYRSLLGIELGHRGCNYHWQPEVLPTFRERQLPFSRISPFVVDHRVCVQVEAIYDEVSARAVRTMQTHLQLTGCRIGFIVVFGKSRFLIRGVRRKEPNELKRPNE